MIIQNFAKGSLLSVTVILFNKSEQTLNGICLKKKNKGLNSSFTIKHTAGDILTIQTFPLYSPFIKEIRNLGAFDSAP
jgi:large subunit ribosomal protein L19